MAAIKLTAKSKDGAIVYDHDGLLRHAINTFDGKEITVTLEPRKRSRSLNQNSFYWTAVLQPIYLAFREYGNDYDREDVHDFLLDRFSRIETIDARTGEIIGHKLLRSSKMSVVQFSEFIEQCILFGAQTLGIEWKLDEYKA